MEVSINGGTTKMDDLGIPPFQETSIQGFINHCRAGPSREDKRYGCQITVVHTCMIYDDKVGANDSNSYGSTKGCIKLLNIP